MARNQKDKCVRRNIRISTYLSLFQTRSLKNHQIFVQLAVGFRVRIFFLRPLTIFVRLKVRKVLQKAEVNHDESSNFLVFFIEIGKFGVQESQILFDQTNFFEFLGLSKSNLRCSHRIIDFVTLFI